MMHPGSMTFVRRVAASARSWRIRVRTPPVSWVVPAEWLAECVDRRRAAASRIVASALCTSWVQTAWLRAARRSRRRHRRWCMSASGVMSARSFHVVMLRPLPQTYCGCRCLGPGEGAGSGGGAVAVGSGATCGPSCALWSCSSCRNRRWVAHRRRRAAAAPRRVVFWERHGRSSCSSWRRFGVGAASCRRRSVGVAVGVSLPSPRSRRWCRRHLLVVVVADCLQLDAHLL